MAQPVYGGEKGEINCAPASAFRVKHPPKNIQCILKVESCDTGNPDHTEFFKLLPFP